METLMARLRDRLAAQRFRNSPVDEQPLGNELLSIDLLRQQARALAQSHKVGMRSGPNLLLPRLDVNEKILCHYNKRTLESEKNRRVTPAAEWLLDNFHLIEEQIRTARRHLPRQFNRELPHLTEGPLADYPRVYHMALDLIAHIDGRVDAPHLSSFVAGYQEVTQLKLGELWAILIMLRLALIENLRRVAVSLSVSRADRDRADEWADRILAVAENNPSKLIVAVGEMAQAQPALNRAFVAEFWRRTQEKSSPVKLAVSWLEERLAEEEQTIEQLVQSESQSQAATQVSVGNCIGSLRFLDAMDWREFVERQSVVEEVLRRDPAGVYAGMDFATRDVYRHTVERIARRSPLTELAVASLALQLARDQAAHPDDRRTHVGFFLLDKGVESLEHHAKMRHSLRSLLAQGTRRHPLTCYLGGILLTTLLVALPLIIWAWPHEGALTSRGLFALLTFLSASQLGVSLVNWFATLFVKPVPLPRLNFSQGIPKAHATLVTVPTLLTSLRGIENLLESLEVRYLANRDDHVFLALLTDFPDAPQEHMPNDQPLVERLMDGIQALNEKYQTDRACIFYLFHRPRRWNAQEGVWMGYERKRGKLADLNRILRGGSPECFSHIAGDLSLLPHIKYVITLDTDTQLPRDAARQLAATMAHPLNRPIYDTARGVIIEGYSILQPRVAVSLPSAGRSRFVKLFAGDPGFDPYTRTVSDVYQDVFREGSFIGKGIYDVDAFERAVHGKFPENRILSHDLLEGSYARSALVSDVQLFEDYPARYSADTQRRHRWMRGDWQIAAWLLPRLPGADVRRVENPISGLSRWKILDNLRRSLVPLALLSLIIFGWVSLPQDRVRWSWFVVGLVGFPFLLAWLTELLRKPKAMPIRLHLRSVLESGARQAAQAMLTITFLPYDAYVSLDAILRTLGRLLFTRRNLLEWQTADDVDQADRGRLRHFLATMWCAPALALTLAVALFESAPPAWPSVAPFLLAWLLAPVAAWWISLPLGE